MWSKSRCTISQNQNFWRSEDGGQEKWFRALNIAVVVSENYKSHSKIRIWMHNSQIKKHPKEHNSQFIKASESVIRNS